MPSARHSTAWPIPAFTPPAARARRRERRNVWLRAQLPCYFNRKLLTPTNSSLPAWRDHMRRRARRFSGIARRKFEEYQMKISSGTLRCPVFLRSFRKVFMGKSFCFFPPILFLNGTRHPLLQKSQTGSALKAALRGWSSLRLPSPRAWAPGHRRQDRYSRKRSYPSGRRLRCR
jgi:hypothetical protein